MKNFFLFVIFLVLLPISAQSQLKSELNLPRAGDELMKEQVVFLEPGEAGENQTWDFRDIRLIEDAYIVHYFTRDDWQIIGTENGKLSFLQVNGDSLLTGGYETPFDLVKYRVPGLLLRFPIAYGTSSQGQFKGRGKHHDRLESVVSGEIQSTADATGSIILPGKDTLNSVTRVHIRKTEKARYIPISSDFEIDHPAIDSLFSGIEPDVITTDTYQWYEEGYRYPVFETSISYRGDSIKKLLISRNAYFYHPAKQAYLPEDSANQVILERKLAAKKTKMVKNESNILSFSCYPNPVNETLHIELSFRQAVAVHVDFLDLHGRLIKRFPSKSPVTYYIETLDAEAYPAGHYMVRVTAGSEMVSEKIVKQ